MTSGITLFWFRQDLRLADNPGLFEAAKNGTVMPIYILDDSAPGFFKMGAASRWWLHHSLKNLWQSLDQKLNFYIGNAEEIICSLLQKHSIDAVYWNRCYEPWRIENDTCLKTSLQTMGMKCKSFNASLLWEPWEVVKSDKTPYKVFTPFYRQASLKTAPPRKELPVPAQLILLQDVSNKNTLETLSLLPKKKWYTSLEAAWQPGEVSAQKTLSQFLERSLPHYSASRDYPFESHVSRLSPHLHFGELSPHQVWHATNAITARGLKKEGDHFLRQLVWREFSYALLYHFPELPTKNFQPKFDGFPWKKNDILLQAWQQGKTGYPIIDAGMRELWQTGTMHNRVRMIVASFLVKNLLIHWHHGAAWFWDCLVDADLANNSASWQWVAGSGVDAAPYFRIFNPVLQGEKFDKEGIYTRHFVPELAQLPKKFLFKPWEAPSSVLKEANIVLGKTYPKPIVDLKTSRDTALDVYHRLFT